MQNMCVISGSCFAVIITEALLCSTLPCKLIFVFVFVFCICICLHLRVLKTLYVHHFI